MGKLSSAVAALLACAACSTGSLQVTVSGLPSGVDAAVTVKGPGTFARALTATQTLSGLDTGSYTVTADAVAIGGASYTGTLTGSPATVSGEAMAMVTVTYAAVPGSLQVTVAGLPAGASGNVMVTGPASFTQTVAATQTLSGLSPGDYTVSASNVTAAPYSYQGTVTGSPATVTSSATANATATYAAITGALQVTISGLPPGANANVLVTGPGLYSQPVVGTQLLSVLAPGTYNITVNATRVVGSIVDQVYTGSGTSASVAAGTTVPVSVSYSALGTGKLWIALSGSLVGYDSSQLATSGSPSPSVSIAITSGEAVAFDRGGNAWVARLSNNLLMFAASQLATSGSPTPVVSIGGPSIPNTDSIAFDSAGNAWLANAVATTIVEFTVAQLASSGTPTANITLSNNGGSLNHPVPLAFDSNGNLWAANLIGNTLVMFTPALLAATGNPVPAVTLSASGGSITRPIGLAFDSNNNLWASNFTTNTIVKFTPAQRSTSGSPTPAVTLSAASGSLNLPTCLAFDNGGNLWVVNRGASTIVKFSASQLASSGSPTPAATIGGLGTVDVGLCAFNPPPVAVPIYQ